MKSLTKTDFKKIGNSRFSRAIDQDKDLKNLAPRHWIYDDFLAALYKNGWVRFSAGFKSGIYGHPKHKYCIKLMGMGVGDNPLFFVETGWYIPHERTMLKAFRDKGFNLGPEAMAEKESIKFLIEQCGVSEEQAHNRCKSNNLLIIERIDGIPFATQTGHYLNYRPDIAVFNSGVLLEAERALRQLRAQLMEANNLGLVHNDPMPANIIFVLNSDNELTAKLVDFELAQDFGGDSPGHVGISVAELYSQRDVPRNSHTGDYTKNLDQHIMNESLVAMRELRMSVEEIENVRSDIDWISVGVSLLGFSMSLNVGKALTHFRKMIS